MRKSRGNSRSKIGAARCKARAKTMAADLRGRACVADTANGTISNFLPFRYHVNSLLQDVWRNVTSPDVPFRDHLHKGALLTSGKR